MKGDFSRSTFDPLKHYNSVRMQQGRVQLDADWNEQVDILLHLITTQLKDLLGDGATMITNPGFAITLDDSVSQPLDEDQVDLPGEDEMSRTQDTTQPVRTMPDFKIGAGHYYVEGILCENEAEVPFSQQPDFPAAATLVKKSVEHDQYLVYLDVWQRHITAIEDPAIREIALGGTDTTTRVKTVWQVKLFPLSGDLVDHQGSHDDGGLSSLPEWQEFVKQSGDRGHLRARWDKDKGRLMENHLYRVEIHTVADETTFKWSRENGSVVFPIIDISLLSTEEDNETILEAKVENLVRDPSQLKEDYWVELVDDVMQLNGHPLPLCQVKELDSPNARVTLEVKKDKIDQIRNEIGTRELHHPLLRRWEDDIKEVIRSDDTAGDQGQEWLNLEPGIQVAFSESGIYQEGDYWLIPARTRLEDGIEWPQRDSQPLSMPPHGIRHNYAPLALLQFGEEGWCVISDEADRFATLPQIDACLAQVDVHFDVHKNNLDQLDNRVTVLEEQQPDFQAPLVQYFETSEEIEPGHVVSVKPSESPESELGVELTDAAKEPNRRLVVGVVKDILKDRAYCRVVLFGRAQCKVVGEIEPGDMLVTSTKLGYAQKAGRFPRSGTILGKALSEISIDDETREEIDKGQLDQSEISKWTGTVDMIVTLR